MFVFSSLVTNLLNIICNAVNIITIHSITPVMFQTQCVFRHSLSFHPGSNMHRIHNTCWGAMMYHWNGTNNGFRRIDSNDLCKCQKWAIKLVEARLSTGHHVRIHMLYHTVSLSKQLSKIPTSIYNSTVHVIKDTLWTYRDPTLSTYSTKSPTSTVSHSAVTVALPHVTRVCRLMVGGRSNL